MSNEIIEVQPQQVAVIATTPFQMIAQAAARGASLEEMRQYMDLQDRMEANEARKAFVAAMAAFKKNPPQILKEKFVGYVNRDGTKTGYSHATLGSVCNAVVEAMGAHGISHRWVTEQPASGMIAVTCILTHCLGHSENNRMEAPPDNSGKKNVIQQIASTQSYLQRYTLLAACGLATNEQTDDDGASAYQEEPKAEPKQEAQKEKSKIGGKGLLAAIASIKAGDFTVERLLADYSLTEDQLTMLSDEFPQGSAQ